MSAAGGHILRDAAAFAIRFSGAAWFIRNIYARRKVTIVLYHDPTPAHFERHLAFLARHYQFIRMRDLAAAVQSRDWSSLPDRSLIITFDDGHSGNFELLPLFRQYRVWPTIFLVSRVVATDRHFWFKHPGVSSARMKGLPNRKRLELLSRDMGFEETREYPESRQALSAAEIETMRDQVDFEAHTCFHPVLPSCDDVEARREIVESRTDLEAMLNAPVRCFSYPNGDYGERDVALVREGGYTLARTIDVGWNDARTDPMLLKITGVTDDAPVSVLAAQLTGVSMYVRYRLRGGRGGRVPQTRVRGVDC